MSIFLDLNPDISGKVKNIVKGAFPYATSSNVTVAKMDKQGNLLGGRVPLFIDSASRGEYFIWGPTSFWGGRRIVGP